MLRDGHKSVVRSGSFLGWAGVPPPLTGTHSEALSQLPCPTSSVCCLRARPRRAGKRQMCVRLRDELPRLAEPVVRAQFYVTCLKMFDCECNQGVCIHWQFIHRVVTSVCEWVIANLKTVGNAFPVAFDTLLFPYGTGSHKLYIRCKKNPLRTHVCESKLYRLT